MTFISDMRNQAEEGNANNEEELFKIAVATYDLQTEGELNYARSLIEMNVHFDTFEEELGNVKDEPESDSYDPNASPADPGGAEEQPLDQQI